MLPLMMRLAPCVFAAVCACSPAKTQTVEIPIAQPSAPAEVDASTPQQSTRSRSPACPSSYSAKQPPTCKDGDNPGTCTYPEGTCFCGGPPNCGGVARLPSPPEWTCEAPRAPCPPIGTPCQGNASCHTGACSSWQGVVECVHGKWTAVMVSPPP